MFLNSKGGRIVFLGISLIFSILNAQQGLPKSEELTDLYEITLLEQKEILELAGAKPPADPPPPVPFIAQKYGYVPFVFVNGSKNPLISYKKMFIVIKGSNPSTGDHPCFIQFDENGVGSCVDTSGSTVSSNYTIPLSSLPSASGYHYAYIPSITSARLYMSIDYQLVLTVNMDSDNTISDPNPALSSEDSYSHLYDKVEFNIEPNQCVINPTLVDYFCLPLPIQVIANGGCNTLYAGIPPSQKREDIFTGYQTALNSISNSSSKTQWGNLLLTQSTNPKNLRLLSTNTAINAAPPIFDQEYLLSSSYGENWLQAVWFDAMSHNAYFETNTLWMDLYQLPGYGLYSGVVDTSGNFQFTKETGTSGSAVTIPLPTSSVPFFAGTGFDATGDATAAPIIEKFLSAGVESGVFPATSSMEAPVNNQYFEAKKPYYQYNPNLTANTGPWYDIYSKVLHSFAIYPYNYYTYAYDDVLGNDNTITSNNILLNPINVIISLGNMSGTIP